MEYTSYSVESYFQFILRRGFHSDFARKMPDEAIMLCNDFAFLGIKIVRTE
jgi:hypothetical protein